MKRLWRWLRAFGWLRIDPIRDPADPWRYDLEREQARREWHRPGEDFAVDQLVRRGCRPWCPCGSLNDLDPDT